MDILTVPHFGAGVVLNSGDEVRSTNELLDAVGVDLGPRGDLRASVTAVPWFVLNDVAGGAGGGPFPWTQVFGLFSAQWAQGPVVLAIGGGLGLSGGFNLPVYTGALFTPVAGTAAPTVTTFTLPNISYSRGAQGGLVTCASFPYVNPAGVQVRPTFFNIGPRSGVFPRAMPGLSVLTFDGTSTYDFDLIEEFDALGTGPQGEFTGGTEAVQLYFRCIAGYNNHLFGAGFDNSDATNGDGPSRLMFSNVGNPFKWGNDNVGAVGTDRAFSDTDAITVGDAGEVIQGLLSSGGALWIGTNKGLHYLRGYGRNSFTTDGTTKIVNALDCVGPHALCEGPDGLLYGVSVFGLWRYANGAVEHLYRATVDPFGRSLGWWDLIWSDASAADSYPGRTNADLIWMFADPYTQAVCVVIPFCDATRGQGSGTDTVIIKYHVETGGLTRWVSDSGDHFTAGTVVKRRAEVPQAILMGNAQTPTTIERYGFRLYPFSRPAATSATVDFGEYLPYGPDGIGVARMFYLTVAWQDLSAGNVLVSVTPIVDDVALSAMPLTVSATEPVSPNDLDYWLDASTASQLVLKRWIDDWNSWEVVSRAVGTGLESVTVPATPSTTTTETRGRVVLPMSFPPTRGSKIVFRATWSGGGRTNVESIGLGPVPIRSAQ